MYLYFLTPFVAWFVAGILKFFTNSIRYRKLAFSHIGYGGMPSNHSAIVSSTLTLILLREGIDSPVFGVAVTYAFIVILDANSLRREVAKHAEKINLLLKSRQCCVDGEVLRESIGHTKVEIFAGVVVGMAVAFFLYRTFLFYFLIY